MQWLKHLWARLHRRAHGRQAQQKRALERDLMARGYTRSEAKKAVSQRDNRARL